MRSANTPLYPDPVLTASIYCHGHLDELLTRVIAPFWRHARARDAEGRCYLWLMRYFRRGEHLKIRVHGPSELAEELRRELAAAVEPFLAGLGPPADDAERTVRGEPFPLDREDERDGLHPDRTLVWTSYRCIPGTMGREPLADDPGLAARFTRCLGWGNEIVLDELRSGEDGAIPQRLRSSLVLKLLVAGPTALRLRDDQVASYLVYHRDWLLLATEGDRAAVLARFDDRLACDAAALRQLERAVAAQRATVPEEQADPRFGAWRRSLAELFAYARAAAGDPNLDRSLYGKDQVFAPLFKVMHGLANLIRVGLSNEAYLSHLVAHAAGAPALAEAG